MRADSVMLTGPRRTAELAETERVRRRGIDVAIGVDSVAAKVDRMNRIYRERLEGNRGTST